VVLEPYEVDPHPMDAVAAAEYLLKA